MINQGEILQTIEMIDQQHLDVRTITMGISLRDCVHPDINVSCNKIYDKICRYAGNLVKTGEQIVLGGSESYTSLCRRHWQNGDLGEHRD